jgi:activator of HSP90 ATPase
MAVSFEISERFNVDAARLYSAWLDSEEHGAMTGGEAYIEASVGGEFTAWDEYIWGKTLELQPNQKIVQAWRTAEFEAADGDSRLEIELKPDGDGTLLTLRHSEIPEGQPDYKQGWEDNYFVPMREYFKGQ